jgi:hypothetical protein
MTLMADGSNDKYRFKTFVGFPILHPVSGDIESFRTVCNMAPELRFVNARRRRAPHTLCN